MPGGYSKENACRPDIVALRDCVRVEFDPYFKNTESEVRVWLGNGKCVSERCDTGIATNDLAAQRKRLETKFNKLVSPVLGPSRASHLLALMRDLPGLDDVNALTQACATGPRFAEPAERTTETRRR